MLRAPETSGKRRKMVELEVFFCQNALGRPKNGLFVPQLQFFTFFSLKLTNFDKNGLQNPLFPQVNSLYMECGSSTDQYEFHKNFKRRPGGKKRAAKVIFSFWTSPRAGFHLQNSEIDPESPFLVWENGLLAETHWIWLAEAWFSSIRTALIFFTTIALQQISVRNLT